MFGFWPDAGLRRLQPGNNSLRDADRRGALRGGHAAGAGNEAGHRSTEAAKRHCAGDTGGTRASGLSRLSEESC